MITDQVEILSLKSSMRDASPTWPPISAALITFTRVRDPKSPISLHPGALTNVAILFRVIRETISTMWQHACNPN